MKFKTSKLVRFHQCDPAGIVFYPQYLVLCNETVEDWFAQAHGVDFFDLHAKLQRGVPMRHLEAEFLAPTVHGETLEFSLVVEKVGGTSIKIRIEAWHGEQLRFCAHQTLVWADVSGPRAVPIDAEWRERFTRYLETPNE
ncbi:acyl-CoA thioesterase [Denitromonas iodatirespirans]|uniref:Acyl-CoA thioesterase n=1 Tax=Denitromonas iodatirespirans TaxID=2795389 RepID=A0A944DJ27_DENI1|nr:thioesterase family protein [Denitromonas iodatirespirans]MBT0963828.1 acyl-CoA thioesterase [Denitromonas iodatirespirans]